MRHRNLLAGMAAVIAAAVIAQPAIAQPATDPLTEPTPAVEEEEADRMITLAELAYRDGVRVEFLRGELTGVTVMSQRGQDGVNTPPAPRDADSLLGAYLAMTPVTVPVPALLARTVATPPPALAERRVVDGPVTATDLAVPDRAGTPRASCSSTHFIGPQWRESYLGMAPRSYRSADHGGAYDYVGSYIVNCTPKGASSDWWAKHRIFRSSSAGALGIRVVNVAVGPGGWEDDRVEETPGVYGRYWTVKYSDGWYSDPTCSCRYLREGLFVDEYPATFI